MSLPRLTVRPLIQADIALLAPVLRQHIRDLHSGEVVESEVAAVMDYMAGGSDALGRHRRYLVACASQSLPAQATPSAQQPQPVPLACMAWSVPDPLMLQHFAAAGAASEAAVELLNAFVAAERLGGQGIGRQLLNAICAATAADGAACLLVNSGPRYRHSWGFYDRVCDSSHGFIDNYYGPGRHAKTWRKALTATAG